MRIHSLTSKETVKAVGVGIGTAVLLAAVMVPLFKLGISPLPQPAGLAFAKTVLGNNNLPLPVGLLFHLVYVTFWGYAYVLLFRDRLTFLNALWLGLFLWVVQLVIFFPIIGWGFLGLAISPKLIVASLVPHVLFAVFLWGLCRLTFKRENLSGLA